MSILWFCVSRCATLGKDGSDMIAKSIGRHTCIELVRLGDGAWRICDPQFDEEDPRHVVAFIERHAFRFELVWVRGSGTNRVFDDLEAAIEAVCDRLDGAESHATSPIPIPHGPPPVAQFR